MKKLTLFLVAMTISLLSFAAQPKRIYAYDLSSALVDKVYTFSFTANETPTSGKIIFYDATSSELVGEIALTNPVLGKNEVEIAEYSLPGNDGQQLNWSVELSAAEVTAFEAVYTGAKKYGRGHATIDNSPESDYFGRVYVTDRRTSNSKSGLYVYTPDLQLINNTVYALGRDESGYARPAVAADGTLFLADYTDARRSGIWVVNPSDLTTCTQFYNGTRDSNGLFTNAAGKEIGSSTSGVGIYGSGANTVLYTMMEDGTNASSAVCYHIGQLDGSILKTWSDVPTWICTAYASINPSTNNAFAATEKGVWVSQNDGTTGRKELAFIDNTGVLQYSIDKGKCEGAGLAVNSDNSKLFICGSTSILEYDVVWDGKTPELALKQTHTISDRYVSTLSFDYAGNLLACTGASYSGTDSDVMRLIQYTIPTDNNTCEVPAKKAYIVTKKEADVTLYTVTTQVVGEGSITGNLGTYEAGASAELTAVANEHYDFVNWTGDVTSNENPLTITVNSDMTITANFEKQKHTLTVFVNDENKGTIDVATGSYEYGTEVALTATPKPGYKLLAWSNKATTPSITLTMDNNKAVSAYFVKEYAADPTFTIEKVWENTHVPTSTSNGYQAVGWDGTIYMQDAGNKKILTYSDADDTGTEYVTSSGIGQQIAVDEAGNLIVFNATFYAANPNAIIIYPNGSTTGTPVSFTLDAPGRCDFLTASGNIYSAEGGYVYFFCKDQKTISRLFIKNGAATAEDVTDDTIANITNAASSQSNVVLDIYGNIHTQSKNAGAFEYNITTLTSTEDPYLAKKNSTIGGCTFELGGKEFWAYVAGTTAYSSEWQLINATDGKLVSEEILFAKDKTSKNSAANWLNVQVVDEKTAYIYQFCPAVAAAVWRVSLKENYTVSASATNGTVTGAGAYQEGATATLTATPNTGYKFVNWTKDGVEVSTEATYSFPVTENVELVANFEALAQYNINAHADHTSKGYVTGRGDYYEGEEVTLKAVAKSAYYFTQWNDGNTDNPRTITVTGAAEYIAEFAEAHPRAWAYDMKLGEDGDNYTFTFKATADGQATITFKDKDGNALAQPASQTIAAFVGENKFTIAKNAFAAGVDAFWSITMDGEPIPAIAEVTDQTRGIYDFYNMMGVVVDNNTDSKDFGKIYIQQSYERSYASSSTSNNGLTTRSNDQKSGVFIYNQALEELNNPSNVGLKPTMPAGYTEIGSSSSAFQRLNIHPKTGNLVFSHAVAGKPAVFAINRDDMTGDVTNLLTGVADMTRSVAHCFDAEGTLYVMDFAGSTGAVYKVINGEATRITEISAKFINAYITMASDGRGGLWISQNRGQMDGAPYYYQLVHVTSTGEFDWWVNQETPHGFEGGSNRGALAYDVERKILAQGRNGKVELYTVSYEPTIELTPLYTIASDDLGNNIDGLAFDYAGDLYVVNSHKEKFQKFTLPTADNICTVAAPALEAVRFTPVYTVSVASNNNEWGIANGGGTFEENQNATITAVAATNYKFVNWTKDDAEVSTENPYTFVVTESATYVANFVEKTKYTINVTYDNIMGTVTGDGSYYEGTEVTLTATAKGGYVFVDWSDGVTEETRTIDELTGDVNLTANFKVAVPRAWAYDLRLDADTDPANYIFTFKTTSAGTATLIFKDEDGNIQNFGTHTATATTAEEKTITIAKTVFAAATKDIYWEVELAGEAIAKMAEITNPARNIYDFYNMMGVVVDNDPNSDEFGKIYIQQSYNGASDGIADRSDTQKAGIFIYNQALEELNAPANTGIKPQLPYTIGANRQVFKRITINPANGDIAFCNNTTTNGGAYAVSRENLAGEAINLTKHISEIQKVNALCFDDEGNLYVVANVSTSGAPNGNIYQIKTDGTYKELTSNGGNLFYDQEIAMASDGHGGLWIAQNRWGTAAGTLFHVNVAENKIDFKVEADKEYSDWFAGANYRGAIAYDKQRDILAVHSQACASVFQVTYAADGVPSISKICQTPNLGRNELDGLAFDYAGDLYVVHSGTERFYKYVLPTNNNTCTVPAPESQIIMKEARYTVTVEANDNAMGTVAGGGEYKTGETATLAATANENYRFVNWTYGTTTVADNPLALVVEGDITVTANFELKPLAMEGVVKRAVQIGESTVVLTHEANGTPHLYKVVAGELEAEISQVGVEAAAAGYLSISDIAATEDGKLVACNYVQTTFGGSNLATFYIWDNLTANPSIWFQSSASSNSATSDQGYTMAVTGTSTNANILVTGLHNTHRGVRMSHFSIIDGKYIDTSDGAVSLPYYYYIGKKFKGASAGVDAAVYNETTHGVKFQLNASPLATENWIIDAELMEPSEFTNPQTYGQDPIVNANIADNTLGKKFNGATYLTVLGKHLMVAPYADGENVAGVKIIDITNGLATAQELETRNITTPQAATAAATAVEVDGTNLLITLVADATIYTFDVALESSVTVDENADNTTALENYDGEVVTATVKRNFEANKYLTLTLPFDMNETQIRNVFGNAIVYALDNVVEYNAEEVHLQFRPVSTITAGTPYILKTAASGYDAEDGFTMEGVEIDLSLKPVTSGTVTMVPVLDAGGTLNQSDEYFLSNNALYCAGTYPRTILGLRAYFKSASPLPIRARVVFQDNAATSIPMVETQPANQVRKVLKDGQLIIIRGEEMYNMQGQRME
ncbi:MAG: hypothetical protein IKY87_03605 [Paludibacteraceae bacterium]|nr:hypothetical protein [Paludibacteraceae bacterium]